MAEEKAIHPLAGLDISIEVQKAFTYMGFKELTPIQARCIPIMMEGHDIIAIAPTGTGKTLGFGIPMLEYVNLRDDRVQEVVLAPTRELAQQIAEELRMCADAAAALDRRMELIQRRIAAV